MNMKSLSEIREFLEAVTERTGVSSPDGIADSISELKATALACGNEAGAKDLWCLEQTLKAQEGYIRAFADLKARKFYEGWCRFEEAELALHFLEPHENEPSARFRLDFIREYIPKWQSLFPYKLFLSPELLEEEKECSICGAKVAPRNPCGHRVGEIYGGQMCCRVVTKLDVMGVGLVDNPVQKYSVPFIPDPVTGKSRDHYNYGVVQYAIDCLRSPFDRWDVEKTTRIQPHSRFRHVGRNDACPCESKKKYKKCCLGKEGVIRPHLQFSFAVPPPAGQMTDVYIP